MDWLALAHEGFQTVPVDEDTRKQAIRYLAQWLTEPGFTAYVPQIHWLIQIQQWAGLLDRFYQILPFGTGGRRGAVGIGPNRMNLWTLGASVQGHCEYLRERFPGMATLQVVLAYDVRRFEDVRKQYNSALPNPLLHLSSRMFAEHAACVYAANGIRAHILPADSPRYVATPELSFTIRYLGAHGGLNISASHNPPDDNGGKFYDERGGQPVPPDDQIMADLVDQVTAIRTLPWTEAIRAGRVQFLDASPHQAYIDLIIRQSLVAPPRFDELQIVFTPLHGVGAQTALEALNGAGFRGTPVEEQMQPDGAFPNVTKTPNPEVPESMDRAERLARSMNADLVLATDPDADRLGSLAPDGRGGWRFLTGNEIAALLTHFKLAKLSQRGELPSSPLIIMTEVTTRLISRIGHSFGAQVVDNLLVGFKYIADVLWQLEQRGEYEDVSGAPADLVLGCEESHGILVTPQIRDKDAAGAALLLAELALEQKRQGQTVVDYLERLARQFGYFRNEVVMVQMTGIVGRQNMARMLDDLRRRPPDSIGGLKVTGFEDLRNEQGRLGPFRGATDRAARNFLLLTLGDRGRIALRPSGTEPKAKAYIEIHSAPRPIGMSEPEWQEVCSAIDAEIRRVATDFLKQAFDRVGLEVPGNELRLSR